MPIAIIAIAAKHSLYSLDPWQKLNALCINASRPLVIYPVKMKCVHV